MTPLLAEAFMSWLYLGVGCYAITYYLRQIVGALRARNAQNVVLADQLTSITRALYKIETVIHKRN